jgi:hypothetical protein
MLVQTAVTSSIARASVLFHVSVRLARSWQEGTIWGRIVQPLRRAFTPGEVFMLRTFVTVSVASVLAAVLSASVASPIATPSSPVVVGKYELRNADRGATKRVKVFYDGRRIATITLRRGQASYHCCTPEACRQIESTDACSTFKVVCDAEGNCSAG